MPVTMSSEKEKSNLLYATVGFFIGFAGLSIYGPLVPKLSHTLHLTPLSAGILAAIANLSGSLLRLPFGAWADKYGPKRPFIVLLLASFVGLLGVLVVMATSYPHHMKGLYPLLLVLGMLVGAGIATFPVGIAQVSYSSDRTRQGTALALYAGLGNLAPGIFALLLPIALSSMGMIPAYAMWAAIMLVAVLWYLIKAPTPTRSSKSQGAGQGFAAAARTIATWPLTFLYFISFGGFLALVAWLPSFWVNSFNMPLIHAGFLTLVFTVTTSLIRIVGGWMADRISPALIIAFSLLLIAVGAGIVSRSSALSEAILGVLTIGTGMGIQNGAVFKYVPNRVPHAVGGAAGIVGGLGAVGGFVIPPAMALAGGADHTSAGFFILTALAIMGIPAIMYLSSGSSRRSANAQYDPEVK